MPDWPHEVPPTAGLELHWRDFIKRYDTSFTSAAAAFLGADSLQLECSGTAALIVALSTLKCRSARRKVIIPAYTCPLVAIAIAHCGLEVSLCDLAPDSLDMDEDDLARLCGADTLAVIPTHLAGRLTDVAAAMRIARDVGAWIIEDAAQAFGGRRRNAAAGTEGDIGFFSLAVGKGLTTYEGGLLHVRDPDLRDDMRKTSAMMIGADMRKGLQRCAQLIGYALFYNPRGLHWLYGKPLRAALQRGDVIAAVGDRFASTVPLHRMGGWRESVGHSALERLPDFLSQTRDRALSRIKVLRGIPGIRVFGDRQDDRGVWPNLVVLMPNETARDTVLDALWANGYGVGRLFCHALPDYDYMQSVAPKAAAPNARAMARRTFTVSNSRWLTDEKMAVLRHTIADAIDHSVHLSSYG